jgi:hypothetical protein
MKMATEFNPGGPIERDGAPINRTTETRDRSNWGMIAAGAIIAFLVIAGMLFSMRDNDTTASYTAPGVTTGQSTITPAPAPNTGKTN